MRPRNLKKELNSGRTSANSQCDARQANLSCFCCAFPCSFSLLSSIAYDPLVLYCPIDPVNIRMNSAPTYVLQPRPRQRFLAVPRIEVVVREEKRESNKSTEPLSIFDANALRIRCDGSTCAVSDSAIDPFPPTQRPKRLRASPPFLLAD